MDSVVSHLLQLLWIGFVKDYGNEGPSRNRAILADRDMFHDWYGRLESPRTGNVE